MKTEKIRMNTKSRAAFEQKQAAAAKAAAAAVAENIGKRAYLERDAAAAEKYAAAAVERKPDGKRAADALRAAAKAAAALKEFDTNGAEALNALDYAQYAINTKAAPLPDIIDGLARIAAFGTLNKVFEKTGNKRISKAKAELAKALTARDSLAELSVDGTQITTKRNKKSGKAMQAEYSADLSAAMFEYSDAVSCDSMDIYGAAYLSLWENLTAYNYSLFDYVPTKVNHGGNGAQIVKERTVFQTACAAARNAIEQHSGFSVSKNNRYVWVEQYTDDSGNIEYERINKKYAVALSYDNGGASYIDISAEETSRFTLCIKKLESVLSKREFTVLQARLNGKSKAEIAQALGMERGTVGTYFQRIAKKAAAVPELAEMLK